MGRQVRRVPLDFDWPLNKPWDGFVNPHYGPCPDPTCRVGLSPAGQWLASERQRGVDPVHGDPRRKAGYLMTFYAGDRVCAQGAPRATGSWATAREEARSGCKATVVDVYADRIRVHWDGEEAPEDGWRARVDFVHVKEAK